MWFCSNCGEGPISSWQSVCVHCSHQKCGSCSVEEDDVGDSWVSGDDGPSERSAIYAGGIEDSTSEVNLDKADYESDLKEGSAAYNEDDRDVALGRVSVSAPVLHSQGRYLETSTADDEDNKSTTSTALVSVFSTDSLSTSITAFSKESGFSIEQIQTATRVFVSIVQDDELLAPLYESARNDVEIGPNRLRRHIRGALKTFADNLKEKAHDHLEFQASRLVHAKARHAARCIASGKDQNHLPQAPGVRYGQESKELEDSSEEETKERTVDDADMGDLRAFRLFLTNSEAYATLQKDIQAFCRTDSTTLQKIRADERPSLPRIPRRDMERTWHSWWEEIKGLARSLLLRLDQLLGVRAAIFLLLNPVFLLTDNILIALGWLEPPLGVGWTRIRCECVSPRKLCLLDNISLTLTLELRRSILRRLH